jgi:hypothetical protein
MMKSFFLPCIVLVIATLFVSSSDGYNIQQQQQSKKSLHRQQHDRPPVSRQNFLSIMAGGITAGVVGTMMDNNGGAGGVLQPDGTVLFTSPVWAKEGAKGTKEDPAFQACLSQCMYDCTKPKGSEQKSRSECLPECKQQCATNKSQLMRGEPINKGGSS